MFLIWYEKIRVTVIAKRLSDGCYASANFISPGNDTITVAKEMTDADGRKYDNKEAEIKLGSYFTTDTIDLMDIKKKLLANDDPAEYRSEYPSDYPIEASRKAPVEDPIKDLGTALALYYVTKSSSRETLKIRSIVRDHYYQTLTSRFHMKGNVEGHLPNGVLGECTAKRVVVLNATIEYLKARDWLLPLEA